MGIIVVDVKGFNLKQFYPKKITFISGQYTAHYLLIPPVAFNTLDRQLKKRVTYLQPYHQGLMLDNILHKYLLYFILLLFMICLIYVKEYQKEIFFKRLLQELETSLHPIVISVDTLLRNVSSSTFPVFIKNNPYCFYHSYNICIA